MNVDKYLTDLLYNFVEDLSSDKNWTLVESFDGIIHILLDRDFKNPYAYEYYNDMIKISKRYQGQEEGKVATELIKIYDKLKQGVENLQNMSENKMPKRTLKWDDIDFEMGRVFIKGELYGTEQDFHSAIDSGEIDMEDDENEDYQEPYEMTDAEADADALASAGYGTDEDYGYYGDDHDEMGYDAYSQYDENLSFAKVYKSILKESYDYKSLDTSIDWKGPYDVLIEDAEEIRTISKTLATELRTGLPIVRVTQQFEIGDWTNQTNVGKPVGTLTLQPGDLVKIQKAYPGFRTIWIGTEK